MSRCASSQLGSRPTKLMVQDVKKAYFFAPATRRVFIELPPEAHEAGKVGLLKQSLYGPRDAAISRPNCLGSVGEVVTGPLEVLWRGGLVSR